MGTAYSSAPREGLAREPCRKSTRITTRKRPKRLRFLHGSLAQFIPLLISTANRFLRLKSRLVSDSRRLESFLKLLWNAVEHHSHCICSERISSNRLLGF